MKLINRIAAAAAITALACTSITALADDHGYTEGLIVNVARIRTVDGKFDEVERVAIRRVLGSSTMQVLDLK